jgi:hypothetical protein
MTTKIHTAVDGHGRPPEVVVIGGQRNDQAMLVSVLDDIVVPRDRARPGRDVLARFRALIERTDPNVVEESTWRGVPTWSYDGMICELQSRTQDPTRRRHRRGRRDRRDDTGDAHPLSSGTEHTRLISTMTMVRHLDFSEVAWRPEGCARIFVAK